MNEEPVRYELDGGVASLVLDVPETRNALSARLLGALRDGLARAQADPAVRVILLTATGSVFCSGADLRDPPAVAAAATPPPPPPGSAAADSAGSAAAGATDLMTDVLQRLRDSDRPTVCRVNGHARGGGLGLIAACDIAVAVDTATFAFSEVRIGVSPAMISVVVLPRIGVTAATELFLTGEAFDARRAERIGLVNSAVAAEALDDAVGRFVDQLQRGGPLALAATKRLLREVPSLERGEAFARMARLSAELFVSAEAAEGIAAFAARRAPSWAPASPPPVTSSPGTPGAPRAARG